MAYQRTLYNAALTFIGANKDKIIRGIKKSPMFTNKITKVYEEKGNKNKTFEVDKPLVNMILN